jgi:hypothetical protein
MAIYIIYVRNCFVADDFEEMLIDLPVGACQYQTCGHILHPINSARKSVFIQHTHHTDQPVDGGRGEGKGVVAVLARVASAVRARWRAGFPIINQPVLKR